MFRYTDFENISCPLEIHNLEVDREYYFVTFNMVYRGFFMQVDDDAVFFHSGEIYFSNHPPLQFEEMALLLSEVTGVAEVPREHQSTPKSNPCAPD